MNLDDSTKSPDCRKNPFNYNLTGCFDEFENLINDNKKSVLAVGVSIVVIMVRTYIICTTQ